MRKVSRKQYYEFSSFVFYVPMWHPLIDHVGKHFEVGGGMSKSMLVPKKITLLPKIPQTVLALEGFLLVL